MEPFSAATARLKSSLVGLLERARLDGGGRRAGDLQRQRGAVQGAAVRGAEDPAEGEADLAAVRRHAGRGVLAVELAGGRAVAGADAGVDHQVPGVAAGRAGVPAHQPRGPGADTALSLAGG